MPAPWEQHVGINRLLGSPSRTSRPANVSAMVLARHPMGILEAGPKAVQSIERLDASAGLGRDSTSRPHALAKAGHPRY